MAKKIIYKLKNSSFKNGRPLLKSSIWLVSVTSNVSMNGFVGNCHPILGNEMKGRQKTR